MKRFWMGVMVFGVGLGVAVGQLQEVRKGVGASSAPRTVSMSGTNFVLDCGQGSYQILTLTNNAFIVPTNIVPGQSVVVYAIQDAAGNRAVTWDTNYFQFALGVPITNTATAGAVDVWTFLPDPRGATNLLVNAVKGFVQH